MTARPRLWLGNALLLLAAVATTLIGFEVVLRVALPQKLYRYPHNLFRSDPEIGFVLSPGFAGELRAPEFRTHLRINSLGFRYAELSDKQDGTSRVLLVGDSFVSALNVEENETFGSVAEQVLTRELGQGRVEIVNAGVPNYGTWHELRILRRFARPLAIDEAVLCVFVGNDLEDNLRPRSAVVRDGFLVEQNYVPGLLPRPVRAWLQRHSMTYAFLWSVWDRARNLFEGRTPDPLHGFGALLTPTGNDHIEEGYSESATLLREAKEEMGAIGIPLLVVVIPQELQVYPEKFAPFVAGASRGGAAGEYDLARPSRRWMEIAESLGIPALDLLPVLRSRSGGPPLYMSLDGHLTVEGNRVAGEALASALAPLLGKTGGAR